MCCDAESLQNLLYHQFNIEVITCVVTLGDITGIYYHTRKKSYFIQVYQCVNSAFHSQLNRKSFGVYSVCGWISYKIIFNPIIYSQTCLKGHLYITNHCI